MHPAPCTEPHAAPTSPGHILLVDDDAQVRQACLRVLSRAGFQVTDAADGQTALALLAGRPFDAVLSDVTMPGLDGLALVRHLRTLGNALPVVLMTGAGTLEGAVAAIEHSVVRYLQKPVELEQLVAAVRLAVRHGRERHQQHLDAQALAARHRRFTSALSRVWMAFQPIVSWEPRGVFGYEALLRSTDLELASPAALLSEAVALDRMEELGAVVRREVAAALDRAPPGATLFVNVDPKDLGGEDLFRPDAPLSQVAHRVVLELTERASIHEVQDLPRRLEALRGLGYRIALDDLGAGYAGLVSLAELRPDIVKLDMALVRGVAQTPVKRSIITAVLAHCHTHGIQVVAEGVETQEEQDAVVALGCDLLQGYLFARPAPSFVRLGGEGVTQGA